MGKVKKTRKFDLKLRKWQLLDCPILYEVAIDYKLEMRKISICFSTYTKKSYHFWSTLTKNIISPQGLFIIRRYKAVCVKQYAATEWLFLPYCQFVVFYPMFVIGLMCQLWRFESNLVLITLRWILVHNYTCWLNPSKMFCFLVPVFFFENQLIVMER